MAQAQISMWVERGCPGFHVETQALVTRAKTPLRRHWAVAIAFGTPLPFCGRSPIWPVAPSQPCNDRGTRSRRGDFSIALAPYCMACIPCESQWVANCQLKVGNPKKRLYWVYSSACILSLMIIPPRLPFACLLSEILIYPTDLAFQFIIPLEASSRNAASNLFDAGDGSISSAPCRSSASCSSSNTTCRLHLARNT
jgi:hypothetical protein